MVWHRFPARNNLPALVGAGFLAYASALQPASAAEAASPWAADALSSARLISGGLQGGAYEAGVEIVLKGGAHTYWRNPGDGGVPPTFEFKGSTNLKSFSVSYPAPMRFSEAGMDTFGYSGEVIFPLRIVPGNAEKPVRVTLDLNYAACEKICMPAQAKLTLTLDPLIDGGANRARIADYRALVPKNLDTPGAPKISVRAGAETGKVWIVSSAPPAGKSGDLFAEGPEGWFFDTKRLESGEFELKLAEKPADAKGPFPPVTLTLTGDAGAYEGVRHLDADGSKP